jgi:hypothetical protein
MEQCTCDLSIPASVAKIQLGTRCRTQAPLCGPNLGLTQEHCMLPARGLPRGLGMGPSSPTRCRGLGLGNSRAVISVRAPGTGVELAPVQ